MRVLVSAYAWRPGAGSEHGLGWNYPTGLSARGHVVHAVVPRRYREEIVAALQERPLPNLTFHFVPERDALVRLGWTVGSTLRYFAWQWEASEVARRLDARVGFDVLHHVSYGALLGGTFLYRVGKPLVFGPVGGGQTAPDAFLHYFGRARTSERLRSTVVRHLWRLDLPAVTAARRAAVVLAANHETEALALRMGATRVIRMASVFLPDESLPERAPERRPSKGLRLLWVGRFLARKGHQLTVEALDEVPDDIDVSLEMVGDGPCYEEFRRWLHSTPRRHPVALRGRLPWHEVMKVYDCADAFIFTSLRDADAAQFVEAMSHGLPVITLDLHGARDLVPPSAGIRVPVTDPRTTRSGLRDAMLALARDPDLRHSMGQAAFRHARRFTMSRRLDDLEQLYADVAMGGRSHRPADPGLRARGSPDRRQE